MNIRTVKILDNVLASNDEIAARNQTRIKDAGVLAINVIASPGAGKTSLIVKTIAALAPRLRVGVIEGDIAGTIDTEKVISAGADDAVQINTGGNCHLEAHMIDRALDQLNLERFEILFIENVGNLVCPTHWRLGEQIKLCLSSTAEGHDKPIKYPEIFTACNVVVLNKIDLIDLVDFDRDFFYKSVRALNPGVPIFEVSCRTNAGIPAWASWLEEELERT